jgi:hypothetical protein
VTGGQYDAHVQVLTAEVRVLMVGSRQVTMSVYNQLDWIEPYAIEPFGRVNPKDAEPHLTYVVGKYDDDDGSLCRSLFINADGLALADQVHDEIAKARTTAYGGVRSEERWRSRLRSPEARRFGKEYIGTSDRAWYEEKARQWEALPLIVLAGLR